MTEQEIKRGQDAHGSAAQNLSGQSISVKSVEACLEDIGGALKASSLSNSQLTRLSDLLGEFEKVLRTPVEGDQGAISSFQSHLSALIERSRVDRNRGAREELERYIRQSMDQPNGLIDLAVLKSVLPEVGHPVLSQLVILYAGLLDQDGAGLAFKALSSEYFEGREKNLVQQALCALGESVGQKGISLVPEQSFGRAFTAHKNYDSFDVDVLKLVVASLAAFSDVAFVEDCLKRIGELGSIRLKRYMPHTAPPQNGGQYVQTEDEFSGAELVAWGIRELANKKYEKLSVSFLSWLESELPSITTGLLASRGAFSRTAAFFILHSE